MKDILQVPWQFARFLDADSQEITTIDQAAKAMAKSLACSEVAELWGVTDAETNDVICYTGNGPNRERLARGITCLPFLLHLCRQIVAHAEQHPDERLGDTEINLARSILAAIPPFQE